VADASPPTHPSASLGGAEGCLDDRAVQDPEDPTPTVAALAHHRRRLSGGRSDLDQPESLWTSTQLRDGRAGILRNSDHPALDGIAVGLPRRLNGDDTDQTPHVRLFVSALAELAALPVYTQDERLTSVEAEARLATRERDWRKRKALLDAESASILLQDYLDSRR